MSHSGKGSVVVLKILSIPAGHPYPRALEPQQGWADITVLPDPITNKDNPKQWWPHPAFEPTWWEGQAKGVDLVHVHFGFEHLTIERTRRFTQLLHEKNIPLVLTVHDLDNPHLEDQSNYHQQLHILIQAAAHVFTLSEKAQGIVDKHYGRLPEITPHPVITAGRARPSTDRAGVFLKSVRANVVRDPQFYRDLGAEIYIHQDAPAQLKAIAHHIHEPLNDAQLYAAITRHPVVVLPYDRGTHSGWLRMCRDLGVSVAVPDHGCYKSQMPDDAGVATYRTGDGKDAARVVALLEEQYPIRPATVPDVNSQHRDVYLALAGEQ